MSAAAEKMQQQAVLSMSRGKTAKHQLLRNQISLTFLATIRRKPSATMSSRGLCCSLCQDDPKENCLLMCLNVKDALCYKARDCLADMLGYERRTAGIWWTSHTCEPKDNMDCREDLYLSVCRTPKRKGRSQLRRRRAQRHLAEPAQAKLDVHQPL